MKFLAIDTSQSYCSAALSVDGLVQQRFEEGTAKQGEVILEMVDTLLQTAKIHIKDLDALAYTAGPGGFTGLRVAAGVIQGFSLAYAIPVIPFSSLHILAEGAYVQYGIDNALVAIDARMNQAYVGQYRRSSLQGSERLLRISDLVLNLETSEPLTAIGFAWTVYKDSIPSRVREQLILREEIDLRIEARHMLALMPTQLKQGMTVSAEQVIPTYIRNHY